MRACRSWCQAGSTYPLHLHGPTTRIHWLLPATTPTLTLHPTRWRHRPIPAAASCQHLALLLSSPPQTGLATDEHTLQTTPTPSIPADRQMGCSENAPSTSLPMTASLQIASTQQTTALVASWAKEHMMHQFALLHVYGTQMKAELS